MCLRRVVLAQRLGMCIPSKLLGLHVISFILLLQLPRVLLLRIAVILRLLHVCLVLVLVVHHVRIVIHLFLMRHCPLVFIFVLRLSSVFLLFFLLFLRQRFSRRLFSLPCLSFCSS